MAESVASGQAHGADGGETRRDFLNVAAVGMAAVGAGIVAWPLLDSMNPTTDVLALSSIEVDLSPIKDGQTIVVTWRGKPVFIRKRTKAEIDQARGVKPADLPDPEADNARVVKDPWLVLVGVCTHLGCVPLSGKGDFGGWFCPCHGSHYDISGRIRRGPAPRNLEVPKYAFLDDKTLRIG